MSKNVKIALIIGGTILGIIIILPLVFGSLLYNLLVEVNRTLLVFYIPLYHFLQSGTNQDGGGLVMGISPR